MSKKLFILNLPSPKGILVIRDYAGGFGIAVPTSRLRFKGINIPHLNLFLPYSAAVAEEASFEYDILDAQALRLSNTEILNIIKKSDPDIIYSMLSLPTIHEDKKILQNIKEELPNVLIVGCGSVCNVIPEEVLDKRSVDLTTEDYFPYVNGLKHLINYIHTKANNLKEFHKLPNFSFMKGSDIIRNQVKFEEKNFEDYIPVYDKLPLEKYEYYSHAENRKYLLMPILGSRGCPRSCFYCPYPLGFGRRTNFMHPKQVADEIEKLNQRGVEYFLFRNQSFTLNINWAEKVCEEIRRRKLKISWFCEAAVDETSKEILDKMHLSGCKEINYGVETGDPNLIKIGKPGVHIQNIEKTFRMAKEIGILRGAHVILGLPGENEITLTMTKKILTDINPDSVHINIATPYPGTKMYDIASKNNWIITNDWRYYTSFDVIMKPTYLEPEILYWNSLEINRNFLKQKITRLYKENFNLKTLNSLKFNYIQILVNEFRFRKRINSFRKYYSPRKI